MFGLCRLLAVTLIVKFWNREAGAVYSPVAVFRVPMVGLYVQTMAGLNVPVPFTVPVN
jgi:hypothetical protein